jgi:MFS transporter, PAT family, beta-lactamase induction signal transducer AmpG
MTTTAEAVHHPSRAARLKAALAVYLEPRVLIILFLGFSAGLPLALSGSTLALRMADQGVDLGTIGLFSLVGLPYTIKFLWAPLVDALAIPGLTRWLGRRRGWLVFSQILLIAAIVFLGTLDPVITPWMVALAALMVATASATQDIVIDAFRIESLKVEEQAAGMAWYVAAYRIGMLASTAGALFLVSGFEGLGFGNSAAWTWTRRSYGRWSAGSIRTSPASTSSHRREAFRRMGTTSRSRRFAVVAMSSRSWTRTVEG